MESLLQIGLIATEAALGLLVGGVQAGAGQADEAELLGRVRWLLCRPEDGDALSLLAGADAVIVGAVIRGERDVTALAGTVRTLQRAGQKILAVAVWGRQAHALAEQLNCPGLLLADPDQADQPPDAALRERICEAVRQAQAAASASSQTAGAFAASPVTAPAAASNTRTLNRQSGHRQVRDLRRLRQPATGFKAASPIRVEDAPESVTVPAEPETDETANAIQQPLPVPEIACAAVAGAADERPAEAALNDDVTDFAVDEAEAAIPADTQEFAITGETTLSEADHLRHDLTRAQAETKQQVAELEAEKQRIADRLATAESGRAAAEAQVRELRTEVMRLTSQLSTAEQEKRRPLPDAAQPGSELHVTQQQILRLEDQLRAAQECARFAEARTEDFFQRFAQERRRAADLTRELAAARNEITRLSSQPENDDSASLREQIGRLEHLRDALIVERDKAIQERDEICEQVSRIEEGLKAFNGQLFQAEPRQAPDALIAERDHALAELETWRQQASGHETALHRLQRQFRALESIREEIAAERDAVRDEIVTERTRSGLLESEAQRLSEANHRLARDLQAATARMLELEAMLAETLSATAPMARQVVFAADSGAEVEDLDFDAMTGADLALIVRLDATVQRLMNGGDFSVAGSPLLTQAADAGLSYDTLLLISQELHKTVKSVIEFIERLMSREENAVEQQQSRLLVMRRVIHELLHTIGTVADYARLKSAPSAVVSEPVNLAEMTSDLIGVIEPLIADRRLSVSVNLPPEARQISTDGHRLRQILSSLLVNAAKFTPSGRISLEARIMGSQAIIAVTDTGIGLDQDDLTRIFEPFERIGRKPGTGLGLSVARQLAESVGGRIEVRSRPGKGSIFAVIIPYVSVVGIRPEAPSLKLSDVLNNDDPLIGEGLLIAEGSDLSKDFR